MINLSVVIQSPSIVWVSWFSQEDHFHHFHRFDGPASMWVYKNGKKKCWRYIRGRVQLGDKV